jgi:hypothetical protein
LLSPILEGLAHNPKRWDDSHIATLTESFGDGDARVPPSFAMFNVMKADYLVARDLMFHATREIEQPKRDTGVYMDTLDYAVYGVAPARLVLAQRSALDVLDKIAVALNELFAVGLAVERIHFKSFWRVRPREQAWHPQLAAAIARGNVALIALSEIAADLSEMEGVSGLLSEVRQARNAGTHRFVVLHDLGVSGFRPSAAIEHHGLVAFQATALRTLRLARAALLHMVEVFEYEERARKPRALTGSMVVRPHHEIRGNPPRRPRLPKRRSSAQETKLAGASSPGRKEKPRRNRS